MTPVLAVSCKAKAQIVTNGLIGRREKMASKKMKLREGREKMRYDDSYYYLLISPHSGNL